MPFTPRDRPPLLAALALAASIAAAAGCSWGRRTSSAQPLTIKGSDTMVILAQKWAEAFMERHPGASVQVSGGGSGTGLAALINGTTTLATASREIQPVERRALADRRGVDATETPVAIDAIAVYVHEDNPIPRLTRAQLEAIFRGRVTEWKALGPDLGPIVLYSRENSSGTYLFFKERILGGYDFAARVQTLPGTAAVINAVSHDPRGIGYGGIGYGEGVRSVPLASEAGVVVAPTKEAALDGRYPLARPLFIYAAGEPEGLAARFIDFALGDEGQALVEGVGYYPLRAPGAGARRARGREASQALARGARDGVGTGVAAPAEGGP